MKVNRDASISYLELIVRPVVRFCLRHSLHIQDLVECVKSVFLEEADKEISQSGETTTASRLSLATGIHRRDITRLRFTDQTKRGERDLITKVIGQWQTDPRFTTKKGDTRVLRETEGDDDFAELVRSVSKEINPATVLFELERVGAVRRSDRGLQLIIQSYIPKGDALAGFTILSSDTDDLISAVEENVVNEISPPNLHIRTTFDNIRPDALPEIQRWLLSEGHAFHSRARDMLSKYDQDINPIENFKGPGEKVSLGSFSRIIKSLRKAL